MGIEGVRLPGAQQYHWAKYWLTAPEERWRNNVRSVVPVPDGVSTEQLIEALRRLIAAHETLRTVYPRGVRTVLPAGEPRVEIRDVTSEPDIRWAPGHFDELLRTPFDLEAEPQARFSLAVADGKPRWLFFVFHHIAIDTFGVLAFQRHLAGALDGPPPAARQLMDDAIPAAGERANDKVLDYLRGIAGRFPASAVPLAVGSPREPSMRQATLDSGSGEEIRRMARRFAVPESAVVLGFYAAAMCRVTGNRRNVIRASSANRFRPEEVDQVGCVAQTLPILLTPPLDASVPQLLGYAKRALTPLYRFGRFDYFQAREEMLRARFSAGTDTDAMLAFNYVDRSAERRSFREIAEQEAFITGPAGKVVFTPLEVDTTDRFGLFVRRSADRFTLTVRWDAALLGAEFVEDFLIGLHDLIFRAAAQPGLFVNDLLAAAPLPSLPAMGEWITRDGCRVSLDDTAALLAGCPAVTSCRVADEAGRLTGYVTGDVDPFALRSYMAARLHEWPAVVVPDHFVVQGADAGDGRSGPPFRAADPPAKALEAALAAVAPDAGWSGASSYVGAGGPLASIGAVLDALRGHGFTGLRYADLFGLTPPAELVSRLGDA